jgi:hypothetical protein
LPQAVARQSWSSPRPQGPSKEHIEAIVEFKRRNPSTKSHRLFAFLEASWNLNKVLGLRTTTSKPARRNEQRSKTKTKRLNEFRFGARRRAQLLMTNWCFSKKDSATTTRAPPGRRSLAI